jgi:hypothetical protein
MEDIIKIKVDSGEAVAEIETVDSAMKKLDTTTQETTEATKSLKAQIREATQQLLEMSDEDPRRQKLIEQIGQMKDQMADAADQIKGNTGPAFESMGNTFGIMTGQLANLDFDGLGKSLTQVGASIGKVNFKMLKEELGGLVKGIGDMGKALLANPIFAIGGAIAAVIVYWDELSAAVSNFNITQGEAIDNMMKSDAMLKETEGLQIQQAEIELLVRAVNDHSKSEEERRGALDKVNYALEQNGIAAINDINNTAGIINAKNLLIQKLQQEAKVRGQMAYLEELYAKQARLNADKGFTTTVSEANAAGLALLGLSGGVIQSMTDMGGSMLGTTVTDLQNVQKEIDFISNSIYNDQQALDALQIKNFEQVQVKKQDIQKQVRVNNKKEKEEEKREEEEHGKEMEGIAIKSLEFKGAVTNQIAIKSITDRHAYEQYLEEENAKKLEAIRKQNLENYITITSNGLQALGDVVSAFNIKDEKRAKKQFQIMKGIQMAAALIDTYKAITGALADTATIPYYMKVANAVIAGATGFAQVAKIAQTQYNTTGGTQGGTGGMDTGVGTGGGGMQAPPIDFSFMQQTGQPNTVETYVLAGNVANALEARQKIIDQSHL